jgi:hypothetical protein
VESLSGLLRQAEVHREIWNAIAVITSSNGSTKVSAASEVADELSAFSHWQEAIGQQRNSRLAQC